MTSVTGWKNIILNVRELLPLLKIRGIDLRKSSELNVTKLPFWLIGLMMKTVINNSPPMKMTWGSHTNKEELKSYCRDVLETAHEMKISMPRFEAAKTFFSV